MNCASVPHRAPRHWIEIALVSPLVTLVRWYRVAQDRAVLRELPEDRLDDLGLTRTDVRREAARPFWDAAPDR